MKKPTKKSAGTKKTQRKKSKSAMGKKKKGDTIDTSLATNDEDETMDQTIDGDKRKNRPSIKHLKAKNNSKEPTTPPPTGGAVPATLPPQSPGAMDPKDPVSLWMNRIIENGVDGLKREYASVPNEGPLDRCLGFSANTGKNRYFNVPCYDGTRPRNDKDPAYYIHANYCSSGHRRNRFLCCQAPMPGTIEDFWKMMVISGADSIVMLCDLMEKGKAKCAEYYPQVLNQPMIVGTFGTVIMTELVMEIDKTLSVAKLRVIPNASSPFVVKQVRWHNWPDHGVPDNYLAIQKAYTHVRDSIKPIVVHCSAGVGRTGTFVMIAILYEIIRTPDFLGCPQILGRLREERYKMVQTEMQYLFIHRCLIDYLRFNNYTVTNIMAYTKFLTDYDAAAKADAAILG